MPNKTEAFFVKNMLVKKTENSEESGNVDVSVFTALGALPIKNASVSIYMWNEENERTLIRQVKTNDSGKAPTINLPVLNNMETPTENGSSEYHLVIESPGYHTIIVIDVEIYPDIATQFNINLTPVPRK